MDFIDTPPNSSASVIEAIEAATLVVIPCRPGLFDIDAMQETIAFARQARTPYAVSSMARRQDVRTWSRRRLTVARRCFAELEVPVWGGQITHRASFSLALTEDEGMKDLRLRPLLDRRNQRLVVGDREVHQSHSRRPRKGRDASRRGLTGPQQRGGDQGPLQSIRASLNVARNGRGCARRAMLLGWRCLRGGAALADTRSMTNSGRRLVSR